MKPVTTSTNAGIAEFSGNDPVAGIARKRVVLEAIRYFAASAVALATDFFSYLGLIRFVGVNYLIAAGIGFLLGLVVIYFLSIRLVFRDRAMTDPVTEFLVFGAIGVAGLALNWLVLYIAVDKLSYGYGLSKLISAVLVFCFNFTLRKFALFNKTHS
jgi:putative flippase GtrA